jgi:hypothetical protein
MTMTAQSIKQEPFCDNVKCNFHRVMVSAGCTGLEHGDLKIERNFFVKDKRLTSIRLCGTCSEVVPLLVSCENEEVATVWTPKDKQLILST